MPTRYKFYELWALYKWPPYTMSQLILLDMHLSESYLKKKITYKIKDFFFWGGWL